MHVQPAASEPSPEVVVVEEEVEEAAVPPDKVETETKTVEDIPPEVVEEVQPKVVEDVKPEVIEKSETVEDPPPSPTPSPTASPTAVPPAQELRRASVLDESAVSRKTSIVMDKATTVEMDNVNYEVIPDPVTRRSTIIITPSRRMSTASDFGQPPTRVPSVMFTTDAAGAITMESLDEDNFEDAVDDGTIAETIEDTSTVPPPQIEQFHLPDIKDIEDVKNIKSVKDIKKKIGGLLCCR